MRALKSSVDRDTKNWVKKTVLERGKKRRASALLHNMAKHPVCAMYCVCGTEAAVTRAVVAIVRSFGCNRPNGVVKIESLNPLEPPNDKLIKDEGKKWNETKNWVKDFSHKVFHPVCNKHILTLSLLLFSVISHADAEKKMYACERKRMTKKCIAWVYVPVHACWNVT